MNDTEKSNRYIPLVQSVALRNSYKAYVRTYGCQQNESDSERISGLLTQMGYESVTTMEDADILVYNTCAIREHAENRVFGNIGEIKHLREKKKHLIVVLCGCMMQQQSVADRVRKQYPFVNIIFGTFLMERLPEFIWRVMSGEKHIVDLSGDGGTNEGLPICREDHIKAWLPIMYGCDNFCSYCIVPYVRGRERSRDMSTVIAEARGLVAQGYKEITLLGQNVNSYGKDNGCTFPQLLREIDAIEGDFIIRFMSSHPKDITSEVIDVMAHSRHVAPQLHLPVQSGSTEILRAMNRRYTREQYIAIAKEAREKIRELTLTTDVIVGFPGESEEDFAETLSLVREVKFDSMFAFCYSKRSGTPAAKMDGQIDKSEQSRRFAELMKVQEEVAFERNRRLCGQTLRVLVDGISNREGCIMGRTLGNISIEFEGGADLVGSFVSVTVTRVQAWQIYGEIRND